MAEGQNNAEALALSDEAVDLLMLLDYETMFCSKELQPLSRTYFAYPHSNAALQFKYFTALVEWLLKKVKVQPDWDEYDDPTTKITNMLAVLKDLGVNLSIVPAKLKSGHGESVCLVLVSLLREVLKRTGFEWGQPIYPDEELADDAEVDSDAELGSVAEDENLGDGEEDDLMYQEEEGKKNDDDDEDHAVIESNIDPKEWLLEVERVAPKLKIQMPNDGKEWREHLQQTRGYKQVIETQFPACKTQLDKLSKELSAHCDRIKTKENFINSQFEDRALDYRTQQEELKGVQAKYTELNEVVMNLQIELKSVMEELEEVKNEMQERSTTATDTAPIVKMKDAFKKLRSDTRQLEVRIGVVNHALMQAKLRQRPQDNQRKGVYAGKPGDDREDGQYDDEDEPY